MHRIAGLALVFFVSACALRPQAGTNVTSVNPLLTAGAKVGIAVAASYACPKIPVAQRGSALAGLALASDLVKNDPRSALAKMKDLLKGNSGMDMVWSTIDEAINQAQSDLQMTVTADQWLVIAEGIVGTAIRACAGSLG